jgi:hypothetical protein
MSRSYRTIIFILHKLPVYLLCWQNVLIFSNNLCCIWKSTVSVSGRENNGKLSWTRQQNVLIQQCFASTFPQPKYTNNNICHLAEAFVQFYFNACIHLKYEWYWGSNPLIWRSKRLALLSYRGAQI